MIKLKNVINKHKSNKIKENSNTRRHLNNGTDHRHSKSCCDQSSPARRTTSCNGPSYKQVSVYLLQISTLVDHNMSDQGELCIPLAKELILNIVITHISCIVD